MKNFETPFMRANLLYVGIRHNVDILFYQKPSDTSRLVYESFIVLLMKLNCF